jgi:hypothetical protein
MAVRKSFLSEIHIWRRIAIPGRVASRKIQAGCAPLCETVIYPSGEEKGKRAKGRKGTAHLSVIESALMEFSPRCTVRPLVVTFALARASLLNESRSC